VRREFYFPFRVEADKFLGDKKITEILLIKHAGEMGKSKTKMIGHRNVR
jgi:hypothetical protein